MRNSIYAMNHSPRMAEQPDSDDTTRKLAIMTEFRRRLGADEFSRLSREIKDNGQFIQTLSDKLELLDRAEQARDERPF